MEGANENRGTLKPVNLKEPGNRKALKDIKNIVGVAPRQCVANKKPLTDKNAVVARRPMTRKYAATLANKLTSSDKEARNKHEINENYKQKKASIEKVCIVDVELPTVEEPQQMERWELITEDSLEDLPVQYAVDIDSLDSNNPLAVVEYVENIYENYRRNESKGCVGPDYMFIQFDINEKMRAILIDWLIEVHYKFELMDETVYLTVNLIDRFLSKQPVVRKKLQLVGVTAMLLACKYEEVSVPVVQDLITISDRAYSREDILSMERTMANTLKFDMSVPTPYVFMRRFLKAAESNKKLELLAFYIIELCLVEYEMLKFKPSMLAASAVFTAQCSLKGFKDWSKTCEVYTNYTVDQLMECSKMMVDFHKKSGTGKLTAVHKKYSTLKYGCAANSEPALFLLDDDDSKLNL